MKVFNKKTWLSPGAGYIVNGSISS